MKRNKSKDFVVCQECGLVRERSYALRAACTACGTMWQEPKKHKVKREKNRKAQEELRKLVSEVLYDAEYL